MNELESYLSRPECKCLRPYQKEILRRFIRRFGNGYPVGRSLVCGLMKLNNRFNGKLINQDFINWLYYY